MELYNNLTVKLKFVAIVNLSRPFYLIDTIELTLFVEIKLRYQSFLMVDAKRGGTLGRVAEKTEKRFHQIPSCETSVRAGSVIKK